jgi:hypothetical protein
MRETFDHIRDRQQHVRAVVDSVRADQRGEPRAEIAAEVARRLAAAAPSSVCCHRSRHRWCTRSLRKPTRRTCN